MKDQLGHGSNSHGMTPVQQENQPFKSRLPGKHYLDPNDPRGTHSQGIQKAAPALQRRHFEAIAADLKSKGASEEEVHAMANKLSTTNPGFRRDFFVAAATGGKYTNKSSGRTSGMSKVKKFIGR